MITEIDESLVGRTVWYFDPRKGICHIEVTGIYVKQTRKRHKCCGLCYDLDVRGTIYTKTIFDTDYLFFESRSKVEDYLKAMIKKSQSDAYADKMLGVE